MGSEEGEKCRRAEVETDEVELIYTYRRSTTKESRMRRLFLRGKNGGGMPCQN